MANAYRVLTEDGAPILIEAGRDGTVVVMWERTGEEILHVRPFVANQLIRGLQYILTSQGHTTWFPVETPQRTTMRPEDV